MIPDDLSPERITERLRTGRYGRSLDVKSKTGSTNDDARAAAEAGAPDGHVVVADSQHAGRGSRGRTWSSPPGTDLYLSIVARPVLPLSELAPLTLAVGLGVARAIARLVGDERVAIKWPNDVLVDDRKCAGILVETSSLGERVGASVLGVGIDVGRERFDDELAPLATSLRLSTGRPFDRAHVLASVLEAIELEVDRFAARGSAAIARDVERKLALLGAQVRCGDVEGELVGLAPSGALRLRTDAGVREIVSGTLRRAP